MPGLRCSGTRHEPLTLDHVKPRLLGHWGITPGLNLLWVHLDRVIQRHDVDLIFIAGPGHGGPALVDSTWLEGSYSEHYPDVSRDAEGMARLFRQFLLPGGVGSDVTPEVPGYELFHVEGSDPCEMHGAMAATRVMGGFLRDAMRLNEGARNFRVVGPDESASNRLGALFEVTGRHGWFSCCAAFIHIVDSMFNQHAKWLKVADEVPWRRPIASLNILLTSHVWQQDHNGFSHQDPGFIDHVVSKKAEMIRVYLPPDANTLLHVRGYKEEGTTTAPFDMVARDRLVEHHAYIREHGQDIPAIREWKWSAVAITPS